MVRGNFSALDDEDDNVLIIDEGDQEPNDQTETTMVHESTLIESDTQSKSPDQNSIAELNSFKSSGKTTRSSTRRRIPPKRIGEESLPTIKLEREDEDDKSSMPDLSASNVSSNSLSNGKRYGPKRTSKPRLEPMALINTTELNGNDNPRLKPRHSYCTLIIMALLSSPNRTMTLNDMYCYISNRFAYYRNSVGNWQNGIRHNLSLSKLFKKVPKPDGGLWTFAKDINLDDQLMNIPSASPQTNAFSNIKRSIAEINTDEQDEPDAKQVRQEKEEMNPLRNLVLEQLKNAAYGLYSNNDMLTQSLNEVGQINGINSNQLPKNSLFEGNAQPGSNLNKTTANGTQNSTECPKISMPGLPSMTLEQLALAQSNWYIAQLATQRGFSLVPSIYDRCLKQVQAYYKKPDNNSKIDENE